MKMKYDTRIEGIGSLQAGSYGNVLVEGSCKFKGDVSFLTCKIAGVSSAQGAMHGDALKVEGSLRVEKDVKVKELDVEGLLRSGQGKIYADRIHVEGVLTNEGEVSADIIEIEGLIKTPSLLGDEIHLNYSQIMSKRVWGGIGGLGFPFHKKLQGVDTIECTKLHAAYVSCKRICAQEIHLTNHCVVEHIECDGDIYVDSTCMIKSITGTYTMHH